MNTRRERQLATRRDNTYPRLAEPRRCRHRQTGLCCTWYYPIHADLDRRVDEERRAIYHHADNYAGQREHTVSHRIMIASVNPAEYQWIPSRRRVRSGRAQPIPRDGALQGDRQKAGVVRRSSGAAARCSVGRDADHAAGVPSRVMPAHCLSGGRREWGVGRPGRRSRRCGGPPRRVAEDRPVW